MSTQAYRSSFMMEIKNAMVYRANLFFYLTYVVIPPLALFFLWKSYFENTGRLLSYDLNGMVTYSIITHFFVSNTPFSAWSEIGESIKDGGLTLWLIKPINHYRIYLARLIGSWVPLWIVSLSGVSAVIFALRNYITFQTNLLYVSVSILFWMGGVILGFTVGYLVNLLSFWTDRSSGGFVLLSGLTYLLSGAVLPLDILPLKQIWLALPFKYSGFFPAQIYLGRVPPAEWPIEFVKMLVWVLVLSIATRIVWNLGLQRYQASGG